MNIHQIAFVIQCEGHTNVKSQFLLEIRHELSRDHGPDLDQKVLTLACESYSHRLPLKQAGAHIRRRLYAFVRSVGWGRLWDRAGGPHLVGGGPSGSTPDRPGESG